MNTLSTSVSTGDRYFSGYPYNTGSQVSSSYRSDRPFCLIHIHSIIPTHSLFLAPVPRNKLPSSVRYPYLAQDSSIPNPTQIITVSNLFSPVHCNYTVTQGSGQLNLGRLDYFDTCRRILSQRIVWTNIHDVSVNLLSHTKNRITI